MQYGFEPKPKNAKPKGRLSKRATRKTAAWETIYSSPEVTVSRNIDFGMEQFKVSPADGRAKTFKGETAWMDAERYASDIDWQALGCTGRINETPRGSLTSNRSQLFVAAAKKRAVNEHFAEMDDVCGAVEPHGKMSGTKGDSKFIDDSNAIRCHLPVGHDGWHEGRDGESWDANRSTWASKRKKAVQKHGGWYSPWHGAYIPSDSPGSPSDIVHDASRNGSLDEFWHVRCLPEHNGQVENLDLSKVDEEFLSDYAENRRTEFEVWQDRFGDTEFSEIVENCLGCKQLVFKMYVEDADYDDWPAEPPVPTTVGFKIYAKKRKTAVQKHAVPSDWRGAYVGWDSPGNPSDIVYGIDLGHNGWWGGWWHVRCIPEHNGQFGGADFDKVDLQYLDEHALDIRTEFLWHPNDGSLSFDNIVENCSGCNQPVFKMEVEDGNFEAYGYYGDKDVYPTSVAFTIYAKKRKTAADHDDEMTDEEAEDWWTEQGIDQDIEDRHEGRRRASRKTANSDIIAYHVEAEEVLDAGHGYLHGSGWLHAGCAERLGLPGLTDQNGYDVVYGYTADEVEEIIEEGAADVGAQMAYERHYDDYSTVYTPDDYGCQFCHQPVFDAKWVDWNEVSVTPRYASRRKTAATAPGYYLVGHAGNPIEGPFASLVDAEAHQPKVLAAAIEYKSGIEDPQWESMKAKPFPYGLNTVNGSRKTADASDHDESTSCYSGYHEKCNDKSCQCYCHPVTSSRKKADLNSCECLECGWIGTVSQLDDLESYALGIEMLCPDCSSSNIEYDADFVSQASRRTASAEWRCTSIGNNEEWTLKDPNGDEGLVVYFEYNNTYEWSVWVDGEFETEGVSNSLEGAQSAAERYMTGDRFGFEGSQKTAGWWAATDSGGINFDFFNQSEDDDMVWGDSPADVMGDHIEWYLKDHPNATEDEVRNYLLSDPVVRSNCAETFVDTYGYGRPMKDEEFRRGVNFSTYDGFFENYR